MERFGDWGARLGYAWRLGVGVVILCGLGAGGAMLAAILIFFAPVTFAELVWGLDGEAALMFVAFASAPIGVGFAVPHLRGAIADYELAEAERRKRSVARMIEKYQRPA